MRKIILSVLGILLIVASFLGAKKIIANKKTPKPKVEKIIKTVFAKKAQNQTIPIIISANGNLKAKRRVELFSEVQGVFRKGAKFFKPGESYRKGQTLIRIDASEYAATVLSAKSNLYNLITSIMPDLRLDYPDIFPKWQAYLNSYDIKKSTPTLPEMVSEKEKYFISGRGILSSYYSVKNLEERLYKYNVTSPFNGILTQTLVTEGTLIRAGQKLGEFINTDIYELEVSIGKSYSDLLKIGKNVTLSDLNGSEEYLGKVARINGNIDQETQTVKAFIEVSNKNLKEGMYLEAKLAAKSETNAIEIDRSLLQENHNIFIVRDSILDLIAVKPVYFSEKTVVIKGVPNGTIMASKPVAGGYAGMLVKIYEDKTAKIQ